MEMDKYRGRLAPTPTGYLHLGHAQTFGIAHARARSRGGTLVFRNEDLDRDRCKPEFVTAMYADLRDYGLDWDEGPDIGGEYGPYNQSDRYAHYLSAWAQLKALGLIYPCLKTRKDLRDSISAPHSNAEEVIFPAEWRAERGSELKYDDPSDVNWRFRVPDDECIEFVDGRLGSCSYTAAKDFGDFLVWRRDGMPSYELAVVVDDIAMAITEVVRGEDLLLSTARQVLIYNALRVNSPRFYHTPLLCDEQGKRLAKRDNALSIRHLLQRNHSFDNGYLHEHR